MRNMVLKTSLSAAATLPLSRENAATLTLTCGSVRHGHRTRFRVSSALDDIRRPPSAA